MIDLRISPLLLVLLVPACITAARPAEEAESDSASLTAGEPLLLDDFESGVTKAGQPWTAGADQNNLGSEATYAEEEGGKSGKAGHFKGKLGRNVAPWPWASITTGVGPGAKADLSGVKAVRFWIKGDGKKYRLALAREAVTDYANYAKEFDAPAEWTQMEIKLSELRQASWGKPVERAWTDVKFLEFGAMTADAPFDVWIDNVELVMDPSKNPPFGANAKSMDEPQTEIDGQVYVLDKFEGTQPANGAVWGSEMDMNNLGTIATARTEDTGTDQKNAIHLSGKMGKKLNAWPWATLSINLEPNANPVDLTNCKGIRFKAKGDGRPYKVAFTRKAVTDYGNFSYMISPGKDFKQYSIPLSKFKQPDWAVKVEPGWKDATSLQFAPTVNETSFDLWVDDVEFVFENGKTIPFPKAK